jgi:DNA-binding MarR family transcriptional regulator
MNNDFAVLSYLDKHQHTTQRKIGKGTGLSAATVNLMLKRMAKKGWVKLERVNANTLRYIITPEGITEKTRLAYRFMKNIYQQINRVNRALDKVILNHRLKYPGNKPQLIFFGPRDSITEILTLAARNLGFGYKLAGTLDELEEVARGGEIIITWRDRDKAGAGERAVNILEVL